VPITIGSSTIASRRAARGSPRPCSARPGCRATSTSLAREAHGRGSRRPKTCSQLTG
jgi:hypothetical protein